jgi:hypothetical protein
LKGEVTGLKNEMNTRFDSLEAKLTPTRTELKDEIDGLKAELSTTATPGKTHHFIYLDTLSRIKQSTHNLSRL